MKHLNNEFPPQTGAYKVKVKKAGGWRDFDTARLQISVGQPYHEEEKFAATIEWVKHRFDHVVICVNDTLQRFNFQYEDRLPAEAAFARAHIEGSDWIRRNLSVIQTLPSVELCRWEDWKTGPDYSLAFQEVNQLFQDDPEFRNAVATEIKNFWERTRTKSSLKGAYDFSEFSRYSQAYLLEETAVFQTMFKMTEAADIYPGSTLLPCRFKLGVGSDRAPFTRIDFSRNSEPDWQNQMPVFAAE